MDRGPPVVGKHGDAFRRSSLCDLPPIALALRGPVEGASGRADLVGRTSGSNSTSHAILLSWLIVCRFSPPKLLHNPRYGVFHLFAKTPRDDPTEYHPHRHLCLGMGSSKTRTSQTNNNLPAAEVCASSTRYSFRRLAPPSTPLYRKRKSELQTGAMAYAIATEQRLLAISAADPTAFFMDQDSKTKDHKLAPWHTPLRRGE